MTKGPFTYQSSSEILVGKLGGGVSTNILFRQTWQNRLLTFQPSYSGC